MILGTKFVFISNVSFSNSEDVERFIKCSQRDDWNIKLVPEHKERAVRGKFLTDVKC